MNKIYILTPVHNRKEKTAQLVKFLKEQTFQNFHFVLIDDGSTDNTEEAVRDELDESKLTTIKGKGNWWWGGSLHQAYKWLKLEHSKGNIRLNEFVMIINDDVVIEEDFLQNGISILKDRKRTMLQALAYSIHTKQLRYAGLKMDWRIYKSSRCEKEGEITHLSTRGLLFRVEDFFETGGFHPIILPHYPSDYEFTMRAGEKGITLMTAPSFKLWVDDKSTGLKAYNNEENFRKFLYNYFFNKRGHDPLGKIVYVALRCPMPWKIINIFRVLKRAARSVKNYFRFKHEEKMGGGM